jgi:hypothetical protein
MGIATGSALAMTVEAVSSKYNLSLLVPTHQGVSPEIQGFYLPIIGVNPLFPLSGRCLIVDFIRRFQRKEA